MRDFVVIIVQSKKYGEQRIKVSAEDAERCMAYTWGICFSKQTQSFYAKTHFTNPKGSLPLSRFLLNCPTDKVVDHRNHDTLDNRRKNIRACSTLINNSNRINPQKNNILGITGVRYSKKLGKFLARFKQKHLGCFNTVDEAELCAKSARDSFYNQTS